MPKVVKTYAPEHRKHRIEELDDGTKRLRRTGCTERGFENLDSCNQGVVKKRAAILERAVIDWISSGQERRKAFLQKFKSLAEFNPRDARTWMIIHDLMSVAHLIDPIDVGQFDEE